MKYLRAAFVWLVLTALSLQADSVDDLVQNRMKDQNIPGISIAVVKNGQLVKAQGYGCANLELDVRASSETVYQMASVTKQFTAAAIMLLVEDSRLRLDDKISVHIANTPKSWSEITIRQLLAMTSGIKDYNKPLGNSREDFDDVKLLRSIAEWPLDFEPGAKWAYSNSNYILLAMIIERVTGRPYDQFLTERVFKPLGMISTRRDIPSEVIKNRASLYELKSNQIVNSGSISPTLFNNGDGGLLTTVLDLAKWDAGLYPGKLFKADTLEQMWTPASSNGVPLKHYGFGWYLNQSGHHRIVLHGGGRPGSSTQLSRFMDANITVAVLMNRSGVNAERLAHEIAAVYIPDLGAYPASGIRQPPKWNAAGHLIAASADQRH